MAAREEGKPPGDKWRLSELDKQVIVPLTISNPLRVASLLYDMLNIWAESERANTFASKKTNDELFEPEKDPDHDFPPTYWLQDFRAGSYLDQNIEGVLAHRLYYLGKTIFESQRVADIAAFDDMLRDNRWHLFSRLRWQLYADFPQQTLGLARKDILARLPILGHTNAEHSHEMVLMLTSHAEVHGKRVFG